MYQLLDKNFSQDIFYFIEFSVLAELTVSWLQLSSSEATVLTAHAREVEQTGPLGRRAGTCSEAGRDRLITQLAGLLGGRPGQEYSSAGNLQQTSPLGWGTKHLHCQGTRAVFYLIQI